MFDFALYVLASVINLAYLNTLLISTKEPEELTSVQSYLLAALGLSATAPWINTVVMPFSIMGLAINYIEQISKDKAKTVYKHD